MQSAGLTSTFISELREQKVELRVGRRLRNHSSIARRAQDIVCVLSMMSYVTEAQKLGLFHTDASTRCECGEPIIIIIIIIIIIMIMIYLPRVKNNNSNSDILQLLLIMEHFKTVSVNCRCMLLLLLL